MDEGEFGGESEQVEESGEEEQIEEDGLTAHQKQIMRLRAGTRTEDRNFEQNKRRGGTETNNPEYEETTTIDRITAVRRQNGNQNGVNQTNSNLDQEVIDVDAEDSENEQEEECQEDEE